MKDKNDMFPALAIRERAQAWANEDERVAAALIYGSVVHGTTHSLSDLDLVIVAHPSQRESLWNERQALAERFLGAPVVFSHEPIWQRPFRLQAWRSDLLLVDLTFDEGTVELWEGIANGFVTLVDRIGLSDDLKTRIATWKRPQFDALDYDRGTWPWLLWLLSRLRHGQYWTVRYGVMDTLNSRVIPMLGGVRHNAEQTLAAQDLQKLYKAAPRSSEPDEVARSLRATAELYELALDRWSERTGKPRPHHPLAHGFMELIRNEIQSD